MLQKNKHSMLAVYGVFALLLATLGLTIWPVGASAQSIDEITALQKRKIISELKNSLGEEKVDSVGEFGSALIVNPDAKFKLKGVYGLEDKLSAILQTKRFSEFRVRAGDLTPEGWKVVSITSSRVNLVLCDDSGKDCKKQNLFYGEYLVPVVPRSEDSPKFNYVDVAALESPLPEAVNAKPNDGGTAKLPAIEKK